MKVAVSAASLSTNQEPNKVAASVARQSRRMLQSACILKIPYHCTLHFLRRYFLDNGVVTDCSSGCLYTCAFVSMHFCKVAIPPARADARDIGNGFGISSQHGAIEKTLDVLRIGLKPYCHESALAVARIRNHVVISAQIDHLTDMVFQKCYTARPHAY